MTTILPDNPHRDPVVPASASAPPRSQWPSLEEIARLTADQLSRNDTVRRERLRSLGQSAPLWLAVVPFTTAPLARLAGVDDIRPSVLELQEQGLVEMRLPPYLRERSGEQPVYAATDAGRAAILDQLDPDAIGRARDLVATFCRRLHGGTVGVPAPVSRWAELGAYSNDPAQLVREFDARIAAAFNARDAAALLNWIEAARPLEDLLERGLDQSLSAAITRASRQLELLTRRARDERSLSDFLPRLEQTRTFRDLVKGPDHLWALHLFGVGGVGKTMALRYLSGALAPRKLKAYTARIDFDYLNPDYPRLDPGLLLWSFGQELRAFDTTGRASELFDKADYKLEVLRQRLAADRGRSRPTADPRFVDAVVAFISALQALERPVILVVDTCEELAKIRPDGSVPENVVETFRILEALHDGPRHLLPDGETSAPGVPALRVVFAGRRPLAQAGHGWRCSTSNQPARPYLRLHELRGFTRAEAVRFLRSRAKVPEPYITPILRNSPDVGGPAIIAWHDPAAVAPDVPRYNPYDLRLYADWALEVPAPAPETIAAATSADYVQLRILRRLEKYAPLRRLMPLIALIKHLDEPLVRALLPDDRADAGLVFERIRQQEWIDERSVASPDGTRTRTVLTVEEGLRGRLCAYFAPRERPDADQLARAMEYFETVTLREDLAKLDWPVFDAAMRVLDLDPARALEWWRRVEHRVLRERGAEWLLELTGTLLADKNAAGHVDPCTSGGGDNVLRPMALASYVSAARLSGRAPSSLLSSPDDRQVPADPRIDETNQWVLRIRYASNRFSVGAASALPSDRLVELAEWAAEAVDGQDRPAHAEILAACASLAASEALVEHVELTPEASRDPALLSLLGAPAGPIALAASIENRRAAWTQAAPDERAAIEALAAFAAVTGARAAALRGDFGAAEALAGAAAALDVDDGVPGFAEWVPPRCLSARIRLEAARVLYPVRLSAAETFSRFFAAGSLPRGADDLDVDRAASLGLLLQSATSLPTTTLLDSVDVERALRVLALPPACAAHRVVPPLFVTVGRELAWSGRVGEAVRHLLRVTPTAVPAIETVRHAERAHAELVLRMRLAEEVPFASGNLSESGPGDRALLGAIAVHAGRTDGLPYLPGLVHRLPPDSEERFAWLHAAWQTLPAQDDEQRQQIVEWAHTYLPAPESVGPTFAGQSVVLDLAEAASISVPMPLAIRTQRVDPAALLDRHPQQIGQALALALRVEAADLSDRRRRGERHSPAADVLQRCARQLGSRHAARVAMAEGDLLVLRLPNAARHLFSRALAFFEECGDEVGAFLAQVRMVVAATAEGEPAPLRPAIASYARLRAGRDDLQLPDWSRLEAEDAPDVLRSDDVPSAWRPTLRRLAMAHAAVKRRAPVRTFLPETTASEGDDRRQPADLRCLLKLAPASDVVSDRRPHQRLRDSRAARTLVSTMTGVLGLLLVSAFFYWTFVAFRWAARAALPADTGTSTFIGLYIAVLLLATIGIPWAVRQVRGALASRARAIVSIVPVDAEDGYRSRTLGTDVQVSVSLVTARLRLVPPSIGPVVHPPVVTTARAAGLVPYDEAAVAFKPAMKPLAEVVRRLESRQMSVWLELPPGLHEPPWEAMLQLAVPRGNPPDAPFAPRLRCRRVMAARARRSTPRDTPVGVLTFSADAASAVVLRGAWSFGHGMRVEEADLRQWTTRPADIRVVHLLGRIDESGHGGVAFQVGRREDARQAKQMTESARERSIRPSEILDTLPAVRLVILQPALATELPTGRSAGDREDAMIVRRFAGELLELGAPAVLVLPRLDAQLASQAASRIARHVAAHHRRGATALEDVVGAVQRELVHLSAARMVVKELALDVTLFCADDWQGGLGQFVSAPPLARVTR